MPERARALDVTGDISRKTTSFMQREALLYSHIKPVRMAITYAALNLWQYPHSQPRGTVNGGVESCPGREGFWKVPGKR